MDIRFVFLLLAVEISALVFNVLHFIENKMDVYITYNTSPFTYNTSTQTYTCFTSVHHCVYADHPYAVFKMAHVTFIVITICCYISLLFIMKYKWEKRIMHTDTGITWYRMFEISVELCLVSNTILLFVVFYLDRMDISECDNASRLVTYENLISYIVLNLIEGGYIYFDILANQAERQRQFVALERQASLTNDNTTERNRDDRLPLMNRNDIEHNSRNYGTTSRDVTNRNTDMV